MLAIQHHIVKPGEAHDLDQCRVSRETLHTQRDLTVINHFLDAVFLIHRSSSFLLSERDMRGHRANVKYRFVCFVIICRHSRCTYGSDAACTEISQIGAIRNAGSKPTHCRHLTKQNFVACQTNQFANLVEGFRLAPVKAETRQKRNSYELPIGEWPFGSTQSGCCGPLSRPLLNLP